MTRKSKLFAALVAAFAAQAGMAASVDYHGYIRSGSGGNSEGGKEACFRINAPAMAGVVGGAGRLGNECDTYGELAFDAAMGEAGGVNFKLHTMLAFGTQQTGDWEQNTPSWRQAWIEAGNVGSGALENATIWAGKRYYRRADVHIVDFFTSEVTGPGAGIENIDVGFAKLSYALFRNNSQDWSDKPIGGYNPQVGDNGKKSFSDHDIRLEGINVGFGSLGFQTNFVQKNLDDDEASIQGKNGWAFDVNHFVSDPIGLGGFNRLDFQIARDGANLNGTAKNWTNNSDKYRAWRLVEHMVFEPKNSAWNGAVFVGYGQEAYGDADYSKSFSLVARPIFHFNDAYSIAFEAGTTRVKPATGDRYYLNKFTVAPQISMGKGFWARPVIRAYYTFANWNDAAGNPVCTGRDCGVPMTGFAGKTSGQSYGVQMETWW